MQQFFFIYTYYLKIKIYRIKYLIFRRRRIYISDLDLMFQFWPKNFKTFKKSVATIIQKNPQLCSAEVWRKLISGNLIIMRWRSKMLQIKQIFRPVDREVGLKRAREAFLFLLTGGVMLLPTGVQRPHLHPELHQRGSSFGSLWGQWQVPAASWCHRRENKNKQSCS